MPSQSNLHNQAMVQSCALLFETVSGSGAVALRLRLIDFRHYFTIFAIFKSVVLKNVVHSFDPCETRRPTRLQTMCNVLKYSKTFLNNCCSVAVNFSIYSCSVLYELVFNFQAG